MKRILFRNATLVTLDPQQPLLSNACLAVAGEKIEAVGQAPDGCFDRVIDAGGLILMPGLVNAHTHSPMTLFRGLKDDCTLDEWLNKYIWPAEAQLDREGCYWGSLLGIAEMLATGTTSVSDMYRSSGELIRAAAEAGIKANICESIVSDGDFDPHTHAGIRESQETIDKWNGFDHGRIRCDTSIQSCWQTDEQLWRYIADFAAERGIGIHVHLAETQSEIAHCWQAYGDSPVRLLERAGVFQNRVIAVHGIYLDDEDQRILKEHNACIVHDPASNLKCCCGFAHLKPYWEKGIHLALGTDGVCSNNSADMFDTIKLTSLVQKMLSGDPCFLPAEELLRMAVEGGLFSQGRTGESGMLRPGLDADLIAVSAEEPSMIPCLSPAANLVYSASGAMVRMTMVRGKILYENSEFTTIDMEQLKQKVKAIVSPFRKKG